MAPQYIFTIEGPPQGHSPGKEILKGIWLSFYPTAKIGVARGTGRARARSSGSWPGWTKDFAGEAFSADGTRIGFLPRSRSSIRRRPSSRSSRRRWAPQRAILQKYEDLSANWSDENADELGRLPGPDRRPEPLGAGPPRRDGHGCAARPSRGCGREHAERRRAPPRRPVPPASPAQRHAPARRADQPPRRGVGGLARAVPEGVQGMRGGRDPRRYFLDNVAGWILELDRGSGIPGGQLLVLAGPEAEPAVPGGEGRVGAAPHPPARAGVGAPVATGPQAKARPGCSTTRSCWAQEQQQEKREGAREITIPPGPRLGDLRHRVQEAAQGLRRQAADGRRELHSCLAADRRRHRAQRCGQDDALPHDRRPGEAGRGRAQGGETVALSYVDQSRDSLKGERTVWEEISGGGKDLVMVGKKEVNSRGVREFVRLPRSGPAERRSRTSREGAQPAAPGHSPQERRQPAPCSTSPPTTSTWTRCARWKRRW